MKGQSVILLLSCFLTAILVGSSPEQTAIDHTLKVKDNDWLFSRALNHVSKTADGIVVTHPSHTIRFSKAGIEFCPSSGAPEWSWVNDEAESVNPVFDEAANKIVYDHSTWKEEYLLKSNTIEQQFVIVEPKRTSIRITGRITSSGEFRSSKNGWQWKNETGEVYLGLVTAYDNKGKVVPASMTVTDSQSTIEISTDQLKDISFPLTIDPEIGAADFRISAMGSDGDAATATASNPAVAHLATASLQYPKGIYLVVWEGGISGEIEIYGQFIDAYTGALIDVNPDPFKTDFQVSNMNNSSNANFDASKPDVVATANEFFVVWAGDDTFDNENEVYAQRIDASVAGLGTKLGSAIRISHMGPDNSATFNAFEPTVVYNSLTNDKYLVVWWGDNATDNRYEIFSQLVLTDGTVPGGGPTTVSAMGFNAFSPRVALNKSNNEYMVTWYGDNLVSGELEVYVHRVGSSGAEVGNDIVISDMGPAGNVNFAAQFPSIAYGPSNTFLVVWQGDDNTAPLVDEENEIFGQIINGSGVETLTDFRISSMGTDGSANFDANTPRVVYDSYFGQFIVTWHGDNNTGGTVDNENEVYEQIVSTAGGEIGTDVRLSSMGGVGNTTYTATNCALVYNPSNLEAMVVWRGDNNTIGGMADNEFEIWGQRFAEVKTEPSAQPTAAASSAITTSSFTVDITAQAVAPDGYIVFRKAGSSPTDVPVDQTVYSVGQAVGTSTVAYVGATPSFSQSSLSAAVTYNFDIFAYNGAEAAINYKTTSPLETSVTTLAVQPTSQATTLVISNPTVSALDVSFTAAPGSPAGYVVLRRASAAPTDVPADGLTYTAGNTIGLSTVAFVGSGTSFSDAGLLANTTYHYAVFSYNGTAASLNYLTASPLISSRTTLIAEPGSQPTLPVFSSVTSSSFDVAYTAASGSPSGYIAIRKTGSAPVTPGDLPADGTVYTAGATIGGSTVAFVGSGVSFSQSALAAATQYFYLVLSYNGSGANTNYLTTSPLTGNKFTLAVEPPSQPTSASFTSPTINSLTLNWAAAAGSPTGYIVLRRSGSAVTDVPSDGTAYTAGNAINSSTVAFVGSAITFSDNSLATNTTYHYAFFSYAGSATTVNYLTTSPLITSRSTLQNAPASQPTSLTFNTVTSGSMNGSFTAAAGAPSGYIVLRKAGSSPTDLPVSGTSYSAGAVIGASTVVASGSATTFASSALSSGVTYFYDIFSFNGAVDAVNYITTSPLEGSQVTTLNEPTNQPTSLVFSSITSTSAQVSFTAAAGTPAGYLVLRKSGSSPTDVPVDGTGYAVGNLINTSTVVFASGGTSFSSTGLTAATTYFYDVFSFNGSTGTYNYLPTSPLEGSHITLATEPTTQPTSPIFSSTTTSSFTLGFSAASGSPAGYLVLRKSGTPPTGVPVDGTTYTAGNSLGDGTVVSVGPALSVAESALSSGTTYHYKVFAFNGSTASLNYLTVSPLSTSTATLCSAPVFNGTTAVTQSEFTLSWPSVVGATSYKLEISSDDFASFFSTYSPKTIAIGPDPLTEVVTDLSPGITYKFKVRAVNAAGESANGTAQKITIPGTPVIGTLQVHPLDQSLVTIPWTTITGADKYFIDISTSASFTSFIPGYESMEVTGTSHDITGLSPGTVYNVRMRSANTSGASPNSSSPSLETLPATPDPFSVLAEDTSPNTFKAKWKTAAGARSYELQVSGDDFVHFVKDYDPKSITDGLEEVVQGLEAKTSYKFRVRSKSPTGYSPYSISIVAETKADNTSAQFKINTTASVSVLRSGFATSTLTVNVSGGSDNRKVFINHRPILADDYLQEQITVKTNDDFTFTVNESMLDDLGMEYYFEATDGAIPATPQSNHSFIYKGLNANSIPSIPGLSAGGQVENYRIISIPYQLEDNLVQAIFGVLGDYDPAKWRLVHYQNGKNVDYPTFNRILPGVGYWFNTVDPVTIKTGEGSVNPANKTTPFTMNLAQGWNQVGNPYPFDISWTAVQSNNNGKVMGKLFTFNPSSGLLEEGSATLKVWSGGFVFADAEINGLEFPVSLKGSARTLEPNAIESQVLDASEWKVKLLLKHGDSENNHIAFGMHPEALTGKDRFDEIEVPRFFHYLEMTTNHPDFFAPHFSNDVVPAQDNYKWDFKVSADQQQKTTSIHWDPAAFGNNDAQLWLYDGSAEALVDMRSTDHYDFELKGEHSFTITYSVSEHDWNPGVTLLGRPWPNPSAGRANIPVVLQNDTDVLVDIVDMNGKKIRTVTNDRLATGMHTLEWGGDKDDGQQASPGLYLVRMSTGSGYVQTRKVIIQ